MDHEGYRNPTGQYQPEQWRSVEYIVSREQRMFTRPHQAHPNPEVRDQSRLLELLALINHKILTGKRVYVEAGGVVYKTLYGGYWRSVFTGIQHYLLRCEELPTSRWTEGGGTTAVVDLPIVYSNEGWTASGHSLSFMLSRD